MMYDVGEQLWSVRETGCFRRTLSVLLLGDPPDRTGTKTLGKLAYTALEAPPESRNTDGKPIISLFLRFLSAGG
jgi:hypothetical protein